MPTPEIAESESQSLRSLLRAARRTLEDAGIPSPEHDARALARHALERTDGGMLELVLEVSPEFEDLFDALVERRATREPLQLILGEVHFHRITLATARGVFIPRPETEQVTETAIQALGSSAVPRVVDLCAGSGSVAIAIASAVPHAQVWAVELDPAAAELARRNARANGTRVVVVEGDAATALGELDGTVDLVVANPPYIPPDGVPRDPEVRRWDPPAALYGGGEDGLDVPRGVAASARRLLRDGGTFVMEHGDLQGAAVRSLVEAAGGFTMIQTRRDLAGRDRYVVARREREERR